MRKSKTILISIGIVLLSLRSLAVIGQDGQRNYVETYTASPKTQAQLLRLLPPVITEVKRGGATVAVMTGMEELIALHKEDLGHLLREVAYFTAHCVRDHKVDFMEGNAASSYMFYHLGTLEPSWGFLLNEIVPYLLVDDDRFVRILVQVLRRPSTTIHLDQGETGQVDSYLRGVIHSPAQGLMPTANYEQRMKDRLANPSYAAIGYAYQAAPETAIRMMLGLYADTDGVLRKDIRLGEHLVTGVLLEQRFRTIAENATTPESRQVIADFAKHRVWWVRLYAAEIMQQEPEFQIPGSVAAFAKDNHPLVRRVGLRIQRANQANAT